jgi:hypothetical protein
MQHLDQQIVQSFRRAGDSFSELESKPDSVPGLRTDARTEAPIY